MDVNGPTNWCNIGPFTFHFVFVKSTITNLFVCALDSLQQFEYIPVAEGPLACGEELK